MRCKQSRAGHIVILSGIGLFTIFIGFLALVVDVGIIVLERARAQNAMDAAALAGGQLLYASDATAKQTAVEYVARNRKVPLSQVVLLETSGSTNHYQVGSGEVWTTSTFTSNYASLRVQSTFVKELLFAPALGFQTATIGARATVRPARGIKGQGKGVLMPWILTLQGDPNDPNDNLGDSVHISSLVVGQTYPLKLGSQKNSRGNFGALALGGTGGDVYRNNIKYGAQVQIRIGDYVTTEPGNMVGPTAQGIASRQATLGEPKWRYIVVPVSSDPYPNGRDEMIVIGFAAMYIVSYVEHSHDVQVSAIYLSPQTWGDLDGNPPGPGQNGNLVTINLDE